MQRNTRRIIAAVAVIALLAAGGAAFTNSIGSFGSNNDQIGYASDTIHGATATDLQYELSPDNSQIDQVLVTLQGDYSAGVGNTATPSNGSDAFAAMFNNDPLTKVACTPGSYDSAQTDTVVTCDFDPSGSHTTGEPTGSGNSFSLTVTSPGAQSDLTNNSGS